MTYKCEICEKPTDTLHEIFFGTANRPLSIKHCIQSPLCVKHHSQAHGDKIKPIFLPAEALSQKGLQKYFCKKRHLDHRNLSIALDHYKGWGEDYIKSIDCKRRCAEYLRMLEL